MSIDPAPSTDPAVHRLPSTTRPVRYDVELAPDIANETFTGAIQIGIAVEEPTDTLILHSNALEIHRLELAAATADGHSGASIACSHRLDPDAELLIIANDGGQFSGSLLLTIDFSGSFDENLVGLYAARFSDDEGREHKLATTQFEAPYARKCFPCFDEPAFKAPFALSLLIDPEHQAVSNGPEIARSADRSDGKVLVTFEPTIPMSTYLVAFVVGPLEFSESIDVDGVALRIVHVPGKSDLTAFALESGAFALRFFTDYFGLPYPGPKLDMIAVPDFAFGAMENLGCVTFREALLLIDPQRSTQAELQRAADVIHHEIAHMWFGDLVTMSWWNGLWLNEAFATFMEMKCTDAFRPEWDRWTDFGISRSVAFDTDALISTRPIEYEVHTPEDAEGMFDVLTYEKGAAVVRMLEQYLGPDRFRDGIRHYMTKHQYGNADTTDLWDAIEETTNEPIRQIMDTWIFQGGFPTITVANDGATTSVSQSRAVSPGDEEHADQTWSIPLRYRHSGSGGEPVTSRVLLRDAPVELPIAAGDWWVANADAAGFLRTNYPPDHLDLLAETATTDLKAVERYALIDDVWAGVTAGTHSAPTFLNLLEALTAETSRPVWVRIIEGFDQLSKLIDGEALDRLQEIVHDAVAPTLAGLGLAPGEGDDDNTRQLRGDLIRAMGTLGNDPEIHAESQRTVAEGLRNPELVDVAVLSAAIGVVASRGDEADFDDFIAANAAATTPQDELRYLFPLADFPETELLDRLFGRIMAGEIRTQNAPFLLRRAIQNREGGRHTWEFITSNWGALTERFASSLITRMVGSLPSLDRPADLAASTAFFAEHSVPSGDQTLRQILEKQRINVNLRQRESANLERFLIG